jgi:hypothetical protein
MTPSLIRVNRRPENREDLTTRAAHLIVDPIGVAGDGLMNGSSCWCSRDIVQFVV